MLKLIVKKKPFQNRFVKDQEAVEPGGGRSSDKIERKAKDESEPGDSPGESTLCPNIRDAPQESHTATGDQNLAE